MRLRQRAAIVAVCLIVAHVKSHCPVITEERIVSKAITDKSAQLMLMAVSQVLVSPLLYLFKTHWQSNSRLLMKSLADK